MRIIHTNAPLPTDTLGKLALYSGMDNLTLFEIRDGLAKLMDDKREAVYRFEMELQSSLLDMSLNGIPVDEGARRNLIKQHNAEQSQLASLINEMLEAIGYFDYYIRQAKAEYAHATDKPAALLPDSWDEWLQIPIGQRREYKAANPTALAKFHKALKEFGAPFNPNSPIQKLRLFYHFFGVDKNLTAEEYFFDPPWLRTYGISEYKSRNTKGEYTPAADREALEKIIRASSSGPQYASFWAAPFAYICLALADISKTLGFLNCKLEKGYFKASFGAVTETGRLSSRQNAQGFGSNAQNITPKLRHILIAPPGYKLAAPDYEQIESRNVGAICFTRFGADAYLNASECGDLHTLVASMVWEDLPWPEDFTLDYLRKYGAFPKEIIKAAKAIANKPFYRHFSYRDAVKRLGHGSNYTGKPGHMSMLTHIPKHLVEHFQSAYFEAFPEIPQWHQWVATQVQTEGEIVTLFNRPRRFFGRPTDDATIRVAVAYEPQSMAADYTNRALLTLHKQAITGGLAIELFLQKHDEIGFRFKEDKEMEVIEQVRKIMEATHTLTSPAGTQRQWVVPTEFESGWNLGRMTDTNPDGLSHPDPSRRRKGESGFKSWVL